jgi:hypothetical protein
MRACLTSSAPSRPPDHRRAAWCLPAGKGQQAEWVVFGKTFFEDLGIAEDYRQQVVEVVRDAARQLPDGTETLGLAKLSLEVLLFAWATTRKRSCAWLRTVTSMRETSARRAGGCARWPRGRNARSVR